MNLYGQPVANALVRSYLVSPESRAFLLCGPTGTGKTTTAHYLADQLGVDRSPIGGFEEIASGEQSADAVRDIARKLRLRPMAGFWRMFVVNECDRMTAAAEAIWLDVLESLPPNVTIVFTTNHIEKLSQRFCNRCETIEYVADATSVQRFALELWQKACPGQLVPPAVRNAGIRDGWSPSYRLAIQDVRKAVALASIEPIPVKTEPTPPAATGKYKSAMW